MNDNDKLQAQEEQTIIQYVAMVFRQFMRKIGYRSAKQREALRAMQAAYIWNNKNESDFYK